ncbi:MAG: DUF3179 domain-containing protein [Acidimicrobiales bacterium]|nr:DUF3179 domain-containing protein [Acidimicrobiales bacterium]
MDLLTSRFRRRTGLLAVLVLLLAACSAGESDEPAESPPEDGTEDGTEPAEDSTSITVDQIASSPSTVTISGLDMARGQAEVEGPSPLVPMDEIISGGPPPDGIPPIDEPRFSSVDDVDFLADNEPVLAVEIDGEARAYPVQILMWHEIVNDTIAGVPVSVTYCPLCNSAVAYDRRLDDLVVDFGTSGMLWNSALVMYDRQTETLWSHFTGQGIVGELTGTTLDTFPVATVPWGRWRDTHPDALVLSRETGFSRDYGRNPYPGYDDVTSQPFLFEGEVDGRFTAMTRIVGIQLDDEALAVPLTQLRDERVVAHELGGQRLVVFWEPGTASALDSASIADGDDVGSTGVFIPAADGQDLTFTGDDGGFTDDQTGSEWNILGHAVDGPLTGERLTPVEHLDTFWFAWAAFQPDSALTEQPAATP